MGIGNPAHRRTIDIVLGEANRQVRASIRNALRQEGLVSIKEVETAVDLRNLLKSHTPDLLIVDEGLEGDVVGVVKDLRKGMLCYNPYVVAVITSSNASAENIRKMMNSGADDVILKPLSVKLLYDRVGGLIDRRKLFLATAEYVGPDRRQGRPDPNAKGMNLTQVPNTLKAKSDGKPLTATDLEKAIREANFQIQAQRFRRDVNRVGILVPDIVAAEAEGKRDDKMKSNLDQLAELGTDLQGQIKGGPYEHIMEMLQTLARTAASLRDTLFDDPDPKSFQLLTPLAEAISKGAATEADDATAEAIAATVQKYQGKKKEDGEDGAA